ncbi:hypothetical protein [Corynebacterium lubricantis]|uniref:hypothetical protein n=1 Tax=Corynebacterium lubricantis TaxID=541095 RepID=UPI00037CBEEE|nr:hypothetical protein [Corynebacterium lubricantis]
MSNFRKAALAGATALTVALGSTTVASAQENPTITFGESNLSSQIGSDVFDVNTNPETNQDPTAEENSENFADGREIFGSTKDGFGEQPAWAQVLYGVTILGGLGALIGTLIGPLYNFVVHGPFAK